MLGGPDLPSSPLRRFPGDHGAGFHDVHPRRVHGDDSGLLGWLDARVGRLPRGYAAWRETRGAPPA